MRKILLFVLLAVLSGIFAAQNQAAENYRVVDGDSLEKGTLRIRLEGIDAPEYLQDCYDAHQEKYRCGLKSMDYLQELTAGKIFCKALSRDRYGRQLSECFNAEGQSINRQMVVSGWAVAYGDMYQSEEQTARANKSGIWQGKFMRPELYRAINRAKDKRNKIKKM
ncbi:MAG: thermonuclease family protein [Alphaproteobacteria bacterium]|nr:thermonuclease family protein [Alphaproteobacteria bacterium]